MTLTPNQHYLRTALSLAYAAKAAYSDEPAKQRRFARLGWDDVETFNNTRSGTQGFVAANDENIVVVFRGTEPKKIRDWLTDLNLRYHKKPVNGGRVHAGFWGAWTSVSVRVRQSLDTLRTNGQTVWLTGHSLGGALAMLAGQNLPAKHRPTAVYTFGQPRVGSPAYARNYKILLKRFINEDDVVPHVPLQGLLIQYKYSHAGQRQIMLADGRITSNIATWNRMLSALAKVAVRGIGSLSAKAISDHSMNKYIAKLENHPTNKRRRA